MHCVLQCNSWVRERVLAQGEGRGRRNGEGGAGTSCQAREERALVSLLAGVCLYVHDASQACDCVLEKNRGYRQSIPLTCNNLATAQDAARAPASAGLQARLHRRRGGKTGCCVIASVARTHTYAQYRPLWSAFQ